MGIWSEFWSERRRGSAKRLHPYRARRLFIETIDRLKSEVRESLRTDVLPEFKDMLNTLRDQGVFGEEESAAQYPTMAILHRVVGLAPSLGREPHELFGQFFEWYQEADQAGDAAIEPLRHALEEWLDRWNINTEWIVQTALSTMWTWEGAYYSRKPDDSWFIPEPVNFHTRHQSDGDNWADLELPDLFDLTIEPRAEVKKRYMGMAEEAIDAQLDKLERIASERGIPRVSTGGKADHFEWLVRAQVCDEPILQIARSSERDQRTVTETIRRFADFLQLQWRPLPVGRPPGSKTKHRVHH